MTKIMASVDLYCFGYGKMKNLSSLAENIRLSGGNLFYYSSVDENNMNKFFNDIMYSISKEVTWEAVFRVRTSKGWKKSSYGNYYSSQFNDLL